MTTTMMLTALPTARQRVDAATTERFRRSFAARMQEICEAYSYFSPPETEGERAVRLRVVQDLLWVDEAMDERDQEMTIEKERAQNEVSEQEQYSSDWAEAHHCGYDHSDRYHDHDHDDEGGDHDGPHGYWD